MLAPLIAIIDYLNFGQGMMLNHIISTAEQKRQRAKANLSLVAEEQCSVSLLKKKEAEVAKCHCTNLEFNPELGNHRKGKRLPSAKNSGNAQVFSQCVGEIFRRGHIYCLSPQQHYSTLRNLKSQDVGLNYLLQSLKGELCLLSS